MDRSQRTALARSVFDARKRAGITQQELADRSGVSLRTIQNVEKGDTLPQEGILVSLLDALNIGPATTPTPSDELPQDIRVFLMVLSQFLVAKEPDERLRFMDRITRQIVSGQ